MMDSYQPGRRTYRSRRFALEQEIWGFGYLNESTPDFPREDRARIAAAIVTAYEQGALSGDLLDMARLVAGAMQDRSSTLEALRWWTHLDGRELFAAIRSLARTVPQVDTLARWVA